jgi:hypothetical protein
MKQLKSIVDQNGNIVEPGGLMRSAYVNAIVLAASVANTDNTAGRLRVRLDLAVGISDLR